MPATAPNSIPNWTHAFSTVDLDVVPAAQAARTLARGAWQPRPRLLIDCGHLKCLRSLGVSHVISELLVLHNAGADVWLNNVDPMLARCLSLLQLNRLFHLAPTPA
ncbi:hypothetical protein DNI29_10625 [Hymenobacter sediminis]|uniref:STAS domain-containing protein n=1 Tax=Hymenobacter sediminis TaxID=2218621 RepID=UPI000DA672AC|nr:STAS domain-containing protein [Hymenobacter sediminis]RPD47883.1 hypothetical protein DNI29_10625 [Hymenobacter sediminis]